LKVRSWAD